ncbi:MAG: hypothetical protein ACLTJ8_04410 [Veillonella atypica]
MDVRKAILQMNLIGHGFAMSLQSRSTNK